MVLCTRILYCEKWSDRSSQSAGCWCFSECQISGCYPVILLVCLNMAGIPEKHWRPHYLALWTANPKYIFSHYSSLFYLQSKDESPNQRTPVAHGHHCDMWMLSSLGRIVEPWSVYQLATTQQSSLQTHKVVSWPGLLPWMWQGARPGVTGRDLLTSASAVPLTVVTSVLFFSFPSSFSSAHFVSTNEWLVGAWLWEHKIDL